MQTGIVLLLVEDEEALRVMLEETLRDGGFAVTTAKNGVEALSLLDSEGEHIRGLITDVNLGAGPDGWDVARHARELIPDLPVVYMSGASGQEWTAQGVPNSTLVAKPFAPVQVVTAIASLLNSSDSHS